ncbi:hypothetical protein B0H11DRAFT_1936229 [Mycena galericulata]|nr:hypothetical protein B0H11DRAFT_1936229 [Mycena galericulata]
MPINAVSETENGKSAGQRILLLWLGLCEETVITLFTYRRGTANKPRGGTPGSANRGGLAGTVARGAPPSKGPVVRGAPARGGASATGGGPPPVRCTVTSETPAPPQESVSSAVRRTALQRSALLDKTLSMIPRLTEGGPNPARLCVPLGRRPASTRPQSNASMHTASEDVDGRLEEAAEEATKKGGGGRKTSSTFGTTEITTATKEALELVLTGKALMGTPSTQVPNYLQGLASNYQGRIANFSLIDAGINFQRASTELEMVRLKYAEVCLQAEVHGLKPPHPPTVWQLSAGARESLTSALRGLASVKGLLRETHPHEEPLHAETCKRNIVTVSN